MIIFRVRHPPPSSGKMPRTSGWESFQIKRELLQFHGVLLSERVSKAFTRLRSVVLNGVGNTGPDSIFNNFTIDVKVVFSLEETMAKYYIVPYM
jgi:hypothetical protein